MRSEPGVLGQGLRVLGRGISDERRMFAFAVSGSCLFGLATVATAYVVGNVVGDVIEPAFATTASTNMPRSWARSPFSLSPLRG